MPTAYLDASALVKLVVAERETASLRRHLRTRSHALTSTVAEVEVCRAAAASAGEAGRRAAQALLAGCERVSLTPSIVQRAIAAGPPELRTLDAIHLATALEVAELVDELVTYDARLAVAARSAGLPVVSPGVIPATTPPE